MNKQPKPHTTATYFRKDLVWTPTLGVLFLITSSSSRTFRVNREREAVQLAGVGVFGKQVLLTLLFTNLTMGSFRLTELPFFIGTHSLRV